MGKHARRGVGQHVQQCLPQLLNPSEIVHLLNRMQFNMRSHPVATQVAHQECVTKGAMGIRLLMPFLTLGLVDTTTQVLLCPRAALTRLCHRGQSTCWSIAVVMVAMASLFQVVLVGHTLDTTPRVPISMSVILALLHTSRLS